LLVWLCFEEKRTFRKLVIEIGKAGVTAFSFIIKMVGELVTGVMKFVSCRMRLLLMGLSALKVPGAKNALKVSIKQLIQWKFFTKSSAKQS